MEREIVTIDEELCNGCGDCVPACHEGALQIIDGKARLVSDLMCDGLGACLGHCPQGAITIETREAEPYDEVKVMEIMVSKGINTVKAHMIHLKEHQEFDFLKQAVGFLKANKNDIQFDVQSLISEVHNYGKPQATPMATTTHHGGGCPGSREQSFAPRQAQPVMDQAPAFDGASQLQQWPVQMHLVNPQAGYFQNSDLLLAADCVAFSMGNFHQTWLKGKSLAIACPKLDGNQDIYLNKLVSMIDDARINTLTVMIMQVPCCGGLLRMAQTAAAQASRKVPVKALVVSLQGEILSEEWV